MCRKYSQIYIDGYTYIHPTVSLLASSYVLYSPSQQTSFPSLSTRTLPPFFSRKIHPHIISPPSIPHLSPLILSQSSPPSLTTNQIISSAKERKDTKSTDRNTNRDKRQTIEVFQFTYSGYLSVRLGEGFELVCGLGGSEKCRVLACGIILYSIHIISLYTISYLDFSLLICHPPYITSHLFSLPPSPIPTSQTQPPPLLLIKNPPPTTHHPSYTPPPLLYPIPSHHFSKSCSSVLWSSRER